MLNTSFPPWPSFSKTEAELVKKVLLSNKVNYWTGEECQKFENNFADFIGTKYAVALSNGTIAIDAALKSLDIGKGDEVIVTSRTFIASASSIVNCGAKPIFADVCLNSQNFKSSEIIKCLTKKTRAILCVHLAGYPCEMDNILKIAKKNNLFVIEDCAQAHGAKYKGKSVGSIGHIGCWSFCQDKIISTGGEGGMITTNNKKIWKKVWSLKDHGKSYEKIKSKKSNKSYTWLHDSFGENWRMTEIQACIGRFQLKKMNNWTKKRNQNQKIIWNACKKIKGLRVPNFNEKSWKGYHSGNVHGAYKCYVFVDRDNIHPSWNRDKILEKIQINGVPCFTGSCSEVYLEKAFENSKLRPSKRLTNAKILGETSLAFLIHPTLRKSDLELTCKMLKHVMSLAQTKYS